MRYFTYKSLRFNLKGFIIIIFILCLSSCEADRNKEIIHFREGEIINPLNLVGFNEGIYDSENQVVIYFEGLGEYSILNLNWSKFIKENEDVKFIFYYSGSYLDELKNVLVESEFPMPMVYDPEKVFYKNNIKEELTFISFLVKKNKIVGMSNPSIPNFQKKLDELKRL